MGSTIIDDDTDNNIDTSPVLTIIVTPQRIINAVNERHENRDIDQETVQSLLMKPRNMMKILSQDQRRSTGYRYGAYINTMGAQTGKSVRPLAV